MRCHFFAGGSCRYTVKSRRTYTLMTAARTASAGARSAPPRDHAPPPRPTRIAPPAPTYQSVTCGCRRGRIHPSHSFGAMGSVARPTAAKVIAPAAQTGLRKTRLFMVGGARLDDLLSVRFGYVHQGPFEKHGRNLHRLDVPLTLLFDLVRKLLETLQGLLLKGNKPLGLPRRISGPAATCGYPEARLNLCYELHGAELAATDADLASSLCTQTLSDLVDVDPCRHLLLLGEVGYREVFIRDHKAHLALICLPSHLSAKRPERRFVLRVLHDFGRQVRVQDNGIIFNQSPVVLVIPPDTFRPWIGCSSTEDPTEQDECPVHPPVLVDRCDAIPLNAWDEEHDQEPLAPSFR